jgi:hypothetical protein
MMIRLLAQNEVERGIGETQRLGILLTVFGDSPSRFSFGKKRNGKISRQCLRAMRNQILRIQAETAITDSQPLCAWVRPENWVRESVHALKSPVIDRARLQPRGSLRRFVPVFRIRVV